jgi:hypothetical protein
MHRQIITLLNQVDLMHLPRSCLGVAAAEVEEEAGMCSRAVVVEEEEASVCER